MHRLGISNAPAAVRRAPRRSAAVVTASVAALLTLAACTANRDPGQAAGSGASTGSGAPTASTASTATSQAPTSSAAPIVPAVITTRPQTSEHISPTDRVSVAIAHGTLTSVTMTNTAGKVVSGALDATHASWHNTEDLGYSKTYRVTAVGKAADGKPVVKHTAYTTVAPGNQTMAYLQRIGGYPLANGSTYGVAIVPIVHFDEQINDEAAAQKALTVTTTPHVDGTWYWADDQNAHWRPRGYWPAGTKVTVTAKIYGVKVGPDLYGQADTSASFTIGRRQVTIAYDTAPKAVNKVHVYDAAGHVVRTMNTAMGEHSGVTVNGTYINFYTMGGTYTVLGHEQPARMCSASYGLPADAPGGYPCEKIYNATKISTDGIYLHYLNTFYAQNHGHDVSHGCLNLNESNSMWFFKHSMVGDPVVIHGATHAPTLKVSQGGDWTLPWSQWVKGSALH
jgi:lipoprotein-anchoring transpeptidase ErfK/SrfK